MNDDGYSNISRGSLLQRLLSLVGCITVLALVYWVSVEVIGRENLFSYYQRFGLSLAGVKAGYLWQLLSHAFFHADIFHLLTNLLLLAVLGGRLLFKIRVSLMLLLMFLGVISGGVLHLVVNCLVEQSSDERILIGVSGACYALLIALTTMSPHQRIYPLPITGANLGLGVVLTELLLLLMQPNLGIPVFSVCGDAISAMGLGALFKMSHACHLGGALAGWALMKYHLRRVN